MSENLNFYLTSFMQDPFSFLKNLYIFKHNEREKKICAIQANYLITKLHNFCFNFSLTQH